MILSMFSFVPSLPMLSVILNIISLHRSFEEALIRNKTFKCLFKWYPYVTIVVNVSQEVQRTMLIYTSLSVQNVYWLIRKVWILLDFVKFVVCCSMLKILHSSYIHYYTILCIFPFVWGLNSQWTITILLSSIIFTVISLNPQVCTYVELTTYIESIDFCILWISWNDSNCNVLNESSLVCRW